VVFFKYWIDKSTPDLGQATSACIFATLTARGWDGDTNAMDEAAHENTA
jgi:hypothetical protein